MKLVFSILTLITLFSLTSSCGSTEKSIGILNIDNLMLSINSAGIAYDVINETKLDSSNGLKYAVALTVTNSGNDVISFNDESFSLTDQNGEQMAYSDLTESVMGTFNEHAYSTTVKPGSSEIIVLFFTVKHHGVYRLSFKSPKSGEIVWMDLPAS